MILYFFKYVNKFIIFNFAVVSLFISFNCYPQNIKSDSIKPWSVDLIDNGFLPRTTVVKTNPFAIFWGPVPWTAEYRIVIESMTAAKQSIQIGCSYLDKSLLLLMIEDSLYQQGQPRLRFNGYRIQGSYKFYFSKYKHRAQGLYAGPLVSWSVVNVSYKQYRTIDDYIRICHFNADIIFGYQQLIADNFAMDFFGGIGYKENTWYLYNSRYNYSVLDIDEMGKFYKNNLKIILGFNFGWAF